MKIAIVLGFSVLGLIAAVIGIGFLLPVQHFASRSMRFETKAIRVWQTIREFKMAGDELEYKTVEEVSERKWVRKIVGENLPFGGTWTFELNEENGATTLTISENGEVYNPVFRFMSRFVFGHYMTMDRYLKELGEKLKT